MVGYLFKLRLIIIKLNNTFDRIFLSCDAGYMRSNLLLNFMIMRRNLNKHPTITDMSYI